MYTSAELQLLRDADPGAALPGIDTAVGNPDPASSLLDYTAISQSRTAPYNYDPANNSVYVNQAGAVLSGINFGTASVIVQANDVTIEDCTFTGTTGFWAINQKPSASDTTVEDCSFVGSKASTPVTAFVNATNNITVENNSFIDTPADAIHMEQGLVSGNYFSGAGYADGAHADAIWVMGSTGATTIANNFIDWTNNSDAAVNTNNAIRISPEQGVDINNVTVSGNYLLGGTYTVGAGNKDGHTVSNISITDNYIGFGQYGAFYPGTEDAADVSGNVVFDYSNPMYSTEAMAAYQAASSGTSNPVTATDISTTPTSTATTLLGNGERIGLFGTTGENNFIGGFGTQYLYAGLGANIFTELAISDSTPNAPDKITTFDPAKDVIDLSRIDANLTAPGVQKFTFIGTAPFSGGGAQVRYQQDPTADVTYVEADLAGDSSPDLEIMINGLVTLRPTNFALVAGQSAAALTDGAALSVARVPIANSSLKEYAYTNVLNQSYSSFEAFYASSSDRSADDLNITSSEDGLILYDNNLTVTRGASVESLQVGTQYAPINYNPSQIIQISATGPENFVFGSNYGAETINGVTASGANADNIQLSTAAFSYLTPGMTQAQDLAAVLANATNTPSGVMIADSRGDSLTLGGMTASTLAANPALLHFV